MSIHEYQRGIEDRLIGYRVTVRKTPDSAPVIDNFELRQAAIECAQRCAAQGWRDVEVETVLEDCVGEWFYEGVLWRGA